MKLFLFWFSSHPLAQNFPSKRTIPHGHGYYRSRSTESRSLDMIGKISLVMWLHFNQSYSKNLSMWDIKPTIIKLREEKHSNPVMSLQRSCKNYALQPSITFISAPWRRRILLWIKHTFNFCSLHSTWKTCLSQGFHTDKNTRRKTGTGKLCDCIIQTCCISYLYYIMLLLNQCF